MAKTHFVKAFRGQRKCQHSPEGQWGVCGQPKNVHEELDHEFTQTALTCEYCRQPINIGDPYKWVAPRAHRAARGTKKNRHQTCPGWKPSELTSSQHLAIIYAAQEDAEASLATVGAGSLEDVDGAAEQLQEIAETFADSIREAVETYTESADAIEEGFGHETYQSEELRDNASMIEDWADNAAYWTPNAFDENEAICLDCADDDPNSPEHTDRNDGEYHEWVDDPGVFEEWVEEQVGDLSDILYDSPV